jgi:hypothetical protein
MAQRRPTEAALRNVLETAVKEATGVVHGIAVSNESDLDDEEHEEEDDEDQPDEDDR